MLAKCANPSCSTPLLYLREGKIFMMDHARNLFSGSDESKVPKAENRVEHFWLCGPCSAKYTLVYLGGVGVQVQAQAAQGLRRWRNAGFAETSKQL
jgi:hypothetical protein